MKFDAPEYVDEYRLNKNFPRIHDDIFALISRDCAKPSGVALDLGSCTGLLSVRLSHIFCQVIGVEANRRNYETAMQYCHPLNVRYFCRRFTRDVAEEILEAFKPFIVVARRVFPEIANGRPEEIKTLSRMFHEAGVQFIAIEGRVVSARSKDALSSLEKEIECFTGFYEPYTRYRNCVILKRI
jgi:hypothetical protein